MSTENTIQPATPDSRTAKGVGCGDWLASLDFLAVIADSEVYETKQIKGSDIPRFWADTQWMHGLADAPDDQLAAFVAHVSDAGNWWHAAWQPWHYEWDIGEGAGSIVFIRLTHAKANNQASERPRTTTEHER